MKQEIGIYGTARRSQTDFIGALVVIALLSVSGCRLTKVGLREEEPAAARDLKPIVIFQRPTDSYTSRKVIVASSQNGNRQTNASAPDDDRRNPLVDVSEAQESAPRTTIPPVAYDPGEQKEDENDDGREEDVERRLRSGRPTIDIDDKRPEDQFTTTVFGRPLIIGGEYEINPSFEEDFELDEDEEDDVFKIGQSISLEFFYPWSDTVYLFLEGQAFYDADVHAEDGERESDVGLERGQTWLYLDRLWGSNFALQLGRQQIQDKREWWWDADLDAIRLHYIQDYFQAELAFAEELGPEATDKNGIDPDQEDVFRVFGRARWEWADKQRLEFFYLHQDDYSDTQRSGDIIADGREDESDADLHWIGARSLGRFKLKTDKLKLGRFQYWLDTAYVWGEETLLGFDDLGPGLLFADERQQLDVEGWAVDVGLTWRLKYLPLPFEPSLTVGYAIGSGDSSPDSGDDRSFRQTGLQDNNWKFRGVDRFRYYGELLRPELSNLQIWTASLGIPLFRNSSIEILYHKYNQVEPADFLRDADIDADPTGLDTDIGQEWDFVIGLEEWAHLELELVAALFLAGDAYGELSGETASSIELKIDYNF